MDSPVLMHCGTQLRPDCSFPLYSDSLNGYMAMKPSSAGNTPLSTTPESRLSQRKGKSAAHSVQFKCLVHRKAEKSWFAVLVLSDGSLGDANEECEWFDGDELALDTEDLLSFSYQVAKGMEFLASKNVSFSHNRCLTQNV